MLASEARDAGLQAQRRRVRADRRAPRRRRRPCARARRAAARDLRRRTRRSTSTRSRRTSASSAPPGRFDLTNAIDRGDLGAALEVLHRMLTATSAQQPKPLHPMQVMASLVFHYQRLLRLDDPAIRTNEQAAAVLGMKSAVRRAVPARSGAAARHRRAAGSARAARPGRARPPRRRAGSTSAPRSTCSSRAWPRSAAATHAGRPARGHDPEQRD